MTYEIATVAAKARALVDAGIMHEPRALYTTLLTSAASAGTPDPAFGGIQTFGVDQDIMRNNEPWPLTITHVVAGIDPQTGLLNEGYATTDVSLLMQSVGLQLSRHQQSYLSANPVPIALWNNVHAGNSIYGLQTVAWDFLKTSQPFVLSARDTVQIELSCVDVPSISSDDVQFTVTVTLHGVGVLSSRPYAFSGRVLVPSAAASMLPTILDTRFFRNDGTEPIVITNMVLSVVDEDTTTIDCPALPFLLVNIRRTGSGTNANWFRGLYSSPFTVSGAPRDFSRMPAQLLGVTSGRFAVHKLPVPLRLDTGDGLDLVKIVAFDDAASIAVNVGLLGYVTVK